jgi:hypothetical protein
MHCWRKTGLLEPFEASPERKTQLIAEAHSRKFELFKFLNLSNQDERDDGEVISDYDQENCFIIGDNKIYDIYNLCDNKIVLLLVIIKTLELSHLGRFLLLWFPTWPVWASCLLGILLSNYLRSARNHCPFRPDLFRVCRLQLQAPV